MISSLCCNDGQWEVSNDGWGTGSPTLFSSSVFLMTRRQSVTSVVCHGVVAVVADVDIVR